MSENPPAVLTELLDRRVREYPEKIFAHFVDGPDWTYTETLRQAQSTAAGLHALGVQQDDLVFTWLPNGPDAIKTWFGVNLLGAIHVPCNLAWRGRMLEHAVKTCGAKWAVVHRDLLARFAEIDLHGIQTIIVVGGDEVSPPDIQLPVRLLPGSVLHGSGPIPDVVLESSHTMQLLFTSGTTGASKAVLSSYRHTERFLESPIPNTFGPEATFLLVLPLFHAGGLSTVYSVLRDGGTLVVPSAFRTDEFWNWVERYSITSTTLIEQMAIFLLGREPTQKDRGHSLKITNISPMGPAAYRFSERFGTTLWTSYGSTEIGAPLCSDAQPERRGVTGRVRMGYEVRLVDERDNEVPVGKPGELVVRTNEPWVLCSGYVGLGEASAQAWRNGWFHTGDLFLRDENGWLFFMDRKKDAIRRRGENISCYEVEQEVLNHPAMKQVVAYAVPIDVAEDEVMVCVVTHDEQTADWHDVITFLRQRAPHYMVPRYFRQIHTLPLTETGKVRKAMLREEGVTDDTWDRNVAGISIKAERIG